MPRETHNKVGTCCRFSRLSPNFRLQHCDAGPALQLPQGGSVLCFTRSRVARHNSTSIACNWCTTNTPVPLLLFAMRATQTAADLGNLSWHTKQRVLLGLLAEVSARTCCCAAVILCALMLCCCFAAVLLCLCCVVTVLPCCCCTAAVPLCRYLAALRLCCCRAAAALLCHRATALLL